MTDDLCDRYRAQLKTALERREQLLEQVRTLLDQQLEAHRRITELSDIRGELCDQVERKGRRIEALEEITHKLARDRFLLDWLESIGIETVYFCDGSAAIVGRDKPLRETLAEFINQGKKRADL